MSSFRLRPDVQQTSQTPVRQQNAPDWSEAHPTAPASGPDVRNQAPEKIPRAVPVSIEQQIIVPSAIRQNGYGDCFFLAPVESLSGSSSGRAAIREMIAENADGSYTVSFRGDPTHPVRVTLNDIKKARITDGGMWSNVLETAFLKYDHAGPFKQSLLDFWQSQGIPHFAKISTTDDVDRLLTGNPGYTENLAPDSSYPPPSTPRDSKATVRHHLEEALDEGEPVCVATPDQGADPLVSSHVYGVMSYDNKTATVIVRNPWGSNDAPLNKPGATKDGITSLADGSLKMSLDTMMKRFTFMSIGKLHSR